MDAQKESIPRCILMNNKNFRAYSTHTHTHNCQLEGKGKYLHEQLVFILYSQISRNCAIVRTWESDQKLEIIPREQLPITILDAYIGFEPSVDKV